MRVFRIILLIIAVALLVFSVKQFMNGYEDWQEAQRIEASYQQTLRGLENKRDELKERVELLKNDTLTKERLVRKRLGFVKPGEIKFKVVKPVEPD